MAMKESIFSVRAYFGLIGLFGMVKGISGFALFLVDPVSVGLAVIIDASVILLLGGAYLYSSVKFPEFVKSSTKFVQSLLVITGVLAGINGLLSIMQGVYGAGLIVSIVGIMVAWYLYLNVRRLEEEHGLENGA
jgi:hypothetical protein